MGGDERRRRRRVRTVREGAAVWTSSKDRATRAELDRLQRALRLMVEASSLLAAAPNAETMLPSVARLAVRELGDWCAIDVLEEDGGTRRVAVEHRRPGRGARAVEAVKGRAPSPSDPRLADVLRTGRASFDPTSMIVPLVARERTLGAATFVVSDVGRRHTKSDLAVAKALGRHIAVGLEDARHCAEAERARDRADAANRAKDVFLATLAHELRSPMGAILQWCHMLREQGLDARRARAVTAIEGSVRLQLRLVEDILDVSRVTSGKLALRMERTDLGAIVRAAVDAVQPAAAAKTVGLELRSAGVPGVRGDPARLQQVVGNLLTNALKVTPAGGRVTVAVTTVGRDVEVSVRDTGRGIAEHLLGAIFERFHQGETWIPGEQGGLGLGLALARHLVERHGGTITAESAGPGRGATFRVRLPAAGDA
jgi:signal transduction histidine kinase